jgi:valyl-tRNA synthetase
VKVTDERMAGAALRAMAVDQKSDGATERRSDEGVAVAPHSQHGRDARDTWQGRLRFWPGRYAKTFQNWHENIRDWCISRQLWWGHRIPVWRLPEGRLADRISLAEFETIVEKLARWASDGRIALTQRAQQEQATAVDIADRSLPYTFVCVRDPNDREVIDELERHGAVQDPDVLDTWFSSGLWPLSTLGWPDETPELAKWNPTSVLCTAREIITLWVSRMVMFNLYLLDRLPFTDVFIHAMIQDGEGRKMSKSLGNGVDPLDIIESHGADALRFTLAHMATNTQDVRMPVEKDPASGKNTSPKFDIGRNFCNKLWNAARFVLSQLSDGATERRSDEGVDESKWSLADRWIVSRFNRTMEAANEALSSYRFDQYAKACYDFFWGDFCDWYLEAIKPAMRDPARKGQTSLVLASVLDGALRLMHPMIPFITEVLYQRLNEVCPKRGLPGRLECSGLRTQDSGLLIKAPWPAVGDFAQAAEHIFPKLQEVIQTIRNVRNELKVGTKQRVDVYVIAPAEPARQLTENREMIESLAMVTLKAVGQDTKPPAGSTRALAAGVEIFVDLGQAAPADVGLSEKRCGELKKLSETLRGRLANPAYTQKAPAHLVQQTRDQLAEAEAEMAKLGCTG